MSTLYFGGYDIPFFNEAQSSMNPNLLAFLGFAALMAKAFAFIFLFMWVRWTIPRFRYDQLMNLGWKKMIPLSLITAAVVLWLNK
jgi:NADH-quinone oxidoreductase subunit H